MALSETGVNENGNLYHAVGLTGLGRTASLARYLETMIADERGIATYIGANPFSLLYLGPARFAATFGPEQF